MVKSNENITVKGSVRVDLLGGTLDLNPINLILPNVVTLNVATSLKAVAQITEIDFDGVEIVSLDYNTAIKFKSSDFTKDKLRSNFFGNLTFIAYLLDLFEIHQGIRLELESGSPAGAGLGGSSAMGVTCFKAFCEYKKIELDRFNAISKVNSLEARILDSGPAGYQDYYPALFGGVLGLVPTPGSVVVDQLFSAELKAYLETHLTLVYSGETRLSGINNWEVYKAFFNKDEKVRKGLSTIAELSQAAYQKIKKNSLSDLSQLIASEGDERRKLFPGILTNSMNSLREDLAQQNKNLGLKVCGAGGGGCFLITHQPTDREFVDQMIAKYQMKKMELIVEKPL